MKIAIHNSKIGFHPRWINHCQENNIPYKIVDCYANDIIEELKGCNALMWHHHHLDPRDLNIAKQILFVLEHIGFKVFPDFNTGWHFDDKLSQKYLLEAINAPMVKSYAFYEKSVALDWINSTPFPKVFKLRGGAGSSNVRLVKSKKEAVKLINKSFGNGFSNYDAVGSLKERWRKYRLGQTSILEPIKGLVRLYNPPTFAKVLGKEIGYAYFQDFIPNNDSDIRVIVIHHKAFALKRFVRNNDFRASGSGKMTFSREEFDERCMKISFEIASKLSLQCAAFDFVFDQENSPLLVELSYGFSVGAYDLCPGYWDEELQWHEGKFNPQGWMVDSVINEIKIKNT